MISKYKIGIFFQTLERTVQRFKDDVKGVAAVEFALIAPLMILLFLGTVEISYAIALDRKISRTASSVADLITQEFNYISKDAVGKIFSISSEIMQPYDVVPCIVISGIEIKASKATVLWSIDNTSNGSASPTSTCGDTIIPIENTARVARAKDEEFPVPTQLMSNNNFLVAAEVFLPHNPIVGTVKYERDVNDNGKLDLEQSIIDLDDVIFLRPRSGQVIKLEGS